MCMYTAQQPICNARTQQYRKPLTSMAQEIAVPKESFIQRGDAPTETRVGVMRLTLPPSPTWPLLLYPKQYSLVFAWMPQVW